MLIFLFCCIDIFEQYQIKEHPLLDVFDSTYGRLELVVPIDFLFIFFQEF